ncbi:MAG TPA: PEP-CTERM sorting domain-containing protein [Usitatibacter sp.]|jgi:hypothetical protein|nr:PEP-CTERM sorting domain-containing protein [Usitatibacter sp.]
MRTPYRAIATIAFALSAASAFAQTSTDSARTNPLARGEDVFMQSMTRSAPQTFGRGAFDNTGIGRPNPRNHVQVTPVPEPSQWAMMLAGLALVGFIVGRNARKPRD